MYNYSSENTLNIAVKQGGSTWKAVLKMRRVVGDENSKAKDPDRGPHGCTEQKRKHCVLTSPAPALGLSSLAVGFMQTLEIRSLRLSSYISVTSMFPKVKWEQ